AVMPVAGHVAAEGAERVDERVRAVDGEDIAAGGQLRLEPERDSAQGRGEGLRLSALGLGCLRLLLRLRLDGRRRRCGGRRSGLHPRFGVTDEDLAAGRKAAVVARQM